MSHQGEHSLVRELGLAEALAIGLGTMIGAGIFVLSGIAAERAGPAAVFSYIVAGLICLPIAMIISELATGMPKAGGSYYFISRALGPLLGSIVGPGNWLGLTFATGFYLIGFGQYLSYFLPVPTWMAVLVAGLFFIYLNYRGAKVSGRIQNIIVVVLVATLLLFVGQGMFAVDPGLQRPFFPYGWGAAVATVGLIIVSFTGFEKVSTIAEEIKRPGRNLPLAIVGSVIIATSLYASILFVATGILSYKTFGRLEAPLVEAAYVFMGRVGIVAMSLAALLATASSANAAIMASSRINFAMGRDEILPGWFNQLHPRYLTPHRSILVTGGLALLLALSSQAEELAEISSALFMISYALLSLSAIVMRQGKPADYRPTFRIPLYPWLPVAGGSLCLAVITTMAHASQLASLALVTLSLGWYLFWGRGRTKVKGELALLMERERPLERVVAAAEHTIEGERHEILVPVANPATAKSLTTLAAGLALGHEGTKVVALRVVPVPAGTPLYAAQAYLEQQEDGQRDILRRAAKHGAVAGVRVKMLLQAAHGIASGILAVAEARPDTRLILLGWRGPLTLSRIRTSIDKEVVRRAPCDVAVLRDRGLKEIRRILIPAGGGPHARLGLRLAHDLTIAEDAEVVVLRVVLNAGEVDLEAEQQALEHLIRGELGEKDGRVKARLVRASSVVAGILAEAQRQDYNLLIIGASEEWFLKNWLFGAIPDIVADRAHCSVLLVRKHEPSGVSWLRRMLRQQV
ncbi:MAG: amino acid permease [Anaerolineae bacterium]